MTCHRKVALHWHVHPPDNRWNNTVKVLLNVTDCTARHIKGKMQHSLPSSIPPSIIVCEGVHERVRVRMLIRACISVSVASQVFPFFFSPIVQCCITVRSPAPDLGLRSTRWGWVLQAVAEPVSHIPSYIFSHKLGESGWKMSLLVSRTQVREWREDSG